MAASSGSGGGGNGSGAVSAGAPGSSIPVFNGWQTPAPPGAGSGAGSKGVVVTPHMLLKLAKQLRDSADPLHGVETALAAVNLTRPGAFQDGDDLKKHIGSGRDGRVKDVIGNVHQVRSQLDKVATKLTEIAHKYSSTQELNEHLVEELTPIIGSVSSALSLGTSSATGGGSGGVPGNGPSGGSGTDASGANPGGGSVDDSVHEQVSGWDGGQDWGTGLPIPVSAVSGTPVLSPA
ncbi:hypothetical protein [Kitasatospora sp. NPDC059571]|uniref:hypothetical protein n=1 Tax=Kitasatospora sp. NPDC059571 TaxID=3346871 RepID=UPI0036C6EFF6